ncbi:type II toxin-antitoxin system RelE family toxin [Glutamicibacter mysorens]
MDTGTLDRLEAAAEELEDITALDAAIVEAGGGTSLDELRRARLMTYTDRNASDARRQIRKLLRNGQERVIVVLSLFADEPRPPASKKLTGRDAWRVRKETGESSARSTKANSSSWSSGWSSWRKLARYLPKVTSRRNETICPGQEVRTKGWPVPER